MFTDVMLQIINYCNEIIPVGLVGLHIFVVNLLNKLPVEGLVHHMHILSPYHEQCNFLSRMFISWYNLNQTSYRAMVNYIGTLSS